MRKVFTICTALLAFISSACSSGNGSTRQSDDERKVTVLSTVPSDALAVSYAENCRNSGFALDSTSIFSGLGLRSIRSSGMAVSLCYNGKTVPVLSIAPVPDNFRDDSTSAYNAVIRAATRKKIRALYIADAPSTPEGTGVLLLSPSESQIKASERHIRAGRSIYDSENFVDAVDKAGDVREMVILRNAGFKRINAGDYFPTAYNAGEVSALMQRSSQWTVLSPGGEKEKAVTLSYPDEETYFARFLASLPESDSRLGRVLPPQTAFALSLPVSNPAFRVQYERYIDANVRLVKYRKQMERLARETGKDPLKWEKELDIKEIAIAEFDGHRIMLVRPGRKVMDRIPDSNPYQGFAAALYGSAFALPDESFTANAKGWTVIGSEAGVRAWCLSGTEDNGFGKWPGKRVRFTIFSDGKYLVWNKKGVRIWNSNL